MLKIKVSDKEYKLKFGYKSFKNTKILKEVMEIRKKIYTPKKNEEGDEEEKETEETEEIENIDEILYLTSKLFLVALQKYHEEFRTDFGDSKSINENIEKADDLIDSYMDEENSMSIIELFEALVDELFANNFLSKKSEMPKETTEVQEAETISTKKEAETS